MALAIGSGFVTANTEDRGERRREHECFQLADQLAHRVQEIRHEAAHLVTAACVLASRHSVAACLVDAANRLMDYHERCLELAESCRGLSVPGQYVPLLHDCARLTTNLLGGYRRFIDEFVELVAEMPDVQRAGRGLSVERAVSLGMEDPDQFFDVVNRINKQLQAIAG
jgi:hypothetical protein